MPRCVCVMVTLLVYGTVGCNQQPPAGSPSKASSKPTVTTNEKASSVSASGQKAADPLIMHNAPGFRLTDQAGKTYSDKDLQGCVWVANFMFTKCKATCPRQTEKFEELQKRVGRWPEQDRIRLVSFTVDPENDTVEQLREYADAHHADVARWKFLTGPRADLWTMSKDGFKLPVSISVTDTSSPITHSPLFVLVDEQQRIRGFYDGLSDEGFRKLLASMRSVLSAPTFDVAKTTHVPMPKDLFDPLWLEQKQADQLATADALQVFHDFKFADNLQQSGIRFVSRAVADAARDFKKNHYDHANGVVVADVHEDGLLDLYFVNQVGGNELWRNVGGGRFENITESAGVGLKDRLCASA